MSTSTSTSANDTKRKRNRWGSTNASSSNSSGSGPSDIDGTRSADKKAVEALLSSAQTNQQRKQPADQQQQHKQQQRHQHQHQQRTNEFPSPSSIKNSGRTNDRNSKRQRQHRDRKDDASSYQWGTTEPTTGTTTTDDEPPPPPPQKPNFGLSGALAQDDATGNVYNGVLLRFSEPPEARTPNTRWRLYVFKKSSAGGVPPKDPSSGKTKGGDDGDLVDVMHVSKQSAYLFGRDRKVADIPVDHPSLSKQHCVLQFRALPEERNGIRERKLRCKPYMIDLESTNGTFVNGVRLEQARYYELRKGDVITLGFSSREYVLLTENTTSA